METRQYNFSSFVRGYHVCRAFWTPYINEVLPTKREKDNPYDRFAVAIIKEERVVGYVPREISKIVSQFLGDDGSGSIVSCKITGEPVDRMIEKGIEVPCVYEVSGHSTRVNQLQRRLIENTTFLQSIREGKGTMKYIVVTLHGPPGAGKTSVKQLLLGRGPIPKEFQNSTNIMNTDRSVRSVCTSRITSEKYTMFKEVSNQQVLEMVAKKVKNESEDPAVRDSSQVSSSSSTSPSEKISSNSENIPPIDPDSEVLQELKEVLTRVDPSNELFDLEWVYLIDSGGQPQFSDILPPLFHHQSLHIVVFRLTDGLNKRPPVRYCKDGQEYELPERLCLTNFEYVERMCEIAEAVEKSTGYISSVLVIGTHLDQLQKGNQQKHVLRQMNSELWTLYLKYESFLVPYDYENCQVIFPVNAVVAKEQTRKEYSSEIQELVYGTAENGRRMEVPVKWLALQLDLVKRGSVLHVKKCCTQGECLGMPKAEVLSALNFFKEVGLNLYYPDSGSDLVFTELDPIIARLSALLKISFKPSRLAKGHAELRKRGLFDKRLLRAAINSEAIPEGIITDEDFLSVLVHLKVISPVSDSGKYFLPSALAFTSSYDNPFTVHFDTEPLVATFDESILYPGFFMMLIIQLVEDKSNVLQYNPGDGVTQYRNSVLLLVKESEFTSQGGLIVVDKKRWIEFNYSGSSSSCTFLRQIISNSLINTTKKMTLDTQKFHFGFICFMCGVNDHTCILNDHFSLAYCSKNKCITSQRFGRNKSCWLMEAEEAVTSTENSTCIFPDEIFQPEDAAHLSVIHSGAVSSGKRPYPYEAEHLPPEKLEKIEVMEVDSTMFPKTRGLEQPDGTDITFKDLLLKEPEKNDVFGIMKQKSADWRAFATAFNVDENFCDGLLKQGVQSTDDNKLEAVLRQWIDSQCSDVTWKKVFDVLKEQKLKRMAAEFKNFLEKDTVKQRYKNSEDFKEFLFDSS